VTRMRRWRRFVMKIFSGGKIENRETREERHGPTSRERARSRHFVGEPGWICGNRRGAKVRPRSPGVAAFGIARVRSPPRPRPELCEPTLYLPKEF